MNEKDLQVLRKIQQHIEAVLTYCISCKNLEEFEADSMRVEACIFNLMQIGELAKTSLSNETKSGMKSIPWNQIYGMRNRIVHGYSGVDMRIVWDVITDDLPELKRELESYLD